MSIDINIALPDQHHFYFLFHKGHNEILLLFTCLFNSSKFSKEFSDIIYAKFLRWQIMDKNRARVFLIKITLLFFEILGLKNEIKQKITKKINNIMGLKKFKTALLLNTEVLPPVCNCQNHNMLAIKNHFDDVRILQA